MGFRHIALCLSLLVGMGTACAEEQWQVYPPNDSQGVLGLDDNSAPTKIQGARATDLQNIKLDISKGMRKRHGYSVVGDTLDVGQGDNPTNPGVDEEDRKSTRL